MINKRDVGGVDAVVVVVDTPYLKQFSTQMLSKLFNKITRIECTYKLLKKYSM